MELEKLIHIASRVLVVFMDINNSPNTTLGMPEQNESSDKPGLLSIPPEIRDKIYDYLLPNVQEFSAAPDERRGLSQQFCPPVLARVHPKIRAEVLARLYTNLRVCITNTSQTASFTKWLGRCNTDIINSIRAIAIDVQISEKIPNGGALLVELSSLPQVKISWHIDMPRNAPVIINIADNEKLDKIMEAVGTAIPQIMESCMPKHPQYDRRVFTQHAFMTLKAELWYQLGFKPQRKTIPDPGARKTSEAKKAAARRRLRQLHWGY